MPGNKIGGAKAAQTNIRKHGEDFYKEIGKLGGKASGTGGFYWLAKNDPEKLRQLSVKGGTISKKHGKYPRKHNTENYSTGETWTDYVEDTRPLSGRRRGRWVRRFLRWG